jgi:hypothetical protein
MEDPMTIAEINKQLATINPGYTARFVEGDQASDDSIDIYFAGTKTRWAIQVGALIGINEYGFENGELAWSKDHGFFPNLKRAVLGLCALLERQP